MGTQTLGSGNTPAKRLHAGLQAVAKRVSLSVSHSNGEVLNCIRLPHGAVVTDVVFYPGSALKADSVMRVGTSASAEMYLPSATYTSVVARATRGLGDRFKISLSDDAAKQFEWLTVSPITQQSVGYLGDVIVTYMLDNVP